MICSDIILHTEYKPLEIYMNFQAQVASQLRINTFFTWMLILMFCQQYVHFTFDRDFHLKAFTYSLTPGEMFGSVDLQCILTLSTCVLHKIAVLQFISCDSVTFCLKQDCYNSITCTCV